MKIRFLNQVSVNLWEVGLRVQVAKQRVCVYRMKFKPSLSDSVIYFR